MASVPEFSLLAFRVYSTSLAIDPENLNTEFNRPALSAGWTELEWHADEGDGFSYGVYGNGSEIVVAYAGTNQGIDWAANITNGIGLGSTQLTKAAIAYLQAKQTYGENISFTGHSLGGGLASIMAVWFDRPATVFDEAFFETTALDPLVMAPMIASLELAGYSVPEFTAFLNSYTITYAAREAKVVNYYLEGEILAAGRFAFPTVMGQDHKVSANIEGNSGISWSIDLHSQGLLAANLLSESFRKATYVSPSVLPILMDERFYAYPTNSPKNENILIKLIRSEQGDGKALTHFASDLQKIGSNNEDLSKAAQAALIAQSMEWYYWQSSDYAGKEFFTATDGLLQYTTAQGDDLPDAKNKAISYVNKWLTPLYNDSGDFGGRGTFDQWNVVVSDSGQSATALDDNKTQIFVGGSGGDNFTGGKANDVIFLNPCSLSRKSSLTH